MRTFGSRQIFGSTEKFLYCFVLRLVMHLSEARNSILSDTRRWWLYLTSVNVFQFNKHGRRFINRKALDEDLRELIVVSLFEEDADVVNGKVPHGKIKQKAERCMVGSDTAASFGKDISKNKPLNLNREVVIFQS